MEGMSNPAELRAIAIDIAIEAAKLIRTRRADITATGDIRDVTQTKSSAVDPVTEVDTAVEKYIVDTLRARRPHDGIMGEEGADITSRTGVTWIVDPIDGTVNFLYGVPDYAVSIGAVVEGQAVAGAVINVAQSKLYSAALGHGAHLRHLDGDSSKPEMPLRCRDEDDPAMALVATGFAYSAKRRRAQAKVLAELLPQVRDIRRMGAAAIDLCRVAEGSVDAYFEHGINPWDFAAGMIIAQEAGAVVASPGWQALSADGRLFYAASSRLEPAFSRLLADCGAARALAPER